MEYLIGSLVAIAVFYFFNKNSSEEAKPKTVMPKVLLSQAYVYNLIKPALPILQVLSEPEKVITQASKYEESKFTKVLVLEDTAYWIKDNQVYSAKVFENKIDGYSTSIVDTMGMDDVQLDKMIFIIDKLTEGTDNDRSDSGN